MTLTSREGRNFTPYARTSDRVRFLEVGCTGVETRRFELVCPVDVAAAAPIAPPVLERLRAVRTRRPRR
jgi:hypothetical protein